MTDPTISVPPLPRSDPAGHDKIAVIAFAGASNWPIWVGQRQNYFADCGLDLRVTLTQSSVRMARDLSSDTAQIALTSIDNVIAYSSGQGEVSLDGPADFFAFMGVDDGLLSIMSQPSVRSIDELRGKVLAVDALTTGYVFVLKEFLAQRRIGDSDVAYAAIGTGAERLNALIAGSCDATLLNAPLCLAAEDSGKVRLARARDCFGSYQGVVGAARRQWSLRNPKVVERFIAAYHRSLAWLADRENKDAALQLLADRMPIVKPVLPQAYDLLVVEGGLCRSLQIDREGTNRVIKLREKYGRAGAKLGEADCYIDDRFRLAALVGS